jgi:hypothetical protein
LEKNAFTFGKFYGWQNTRLYLFIGVEFEPGLCSCRDAEKNISKSKRRDGSTRCDISEIFVECAKRFEPMENPVQCIRQYPVGALAPVPAQDNMQLQGVCAPT